MAVELMDLHIGCPSDATPRYLFMNEADLKMKPWEIMRPDGVVVAEEIGWVGCEQLDVLVSLTADFPWQGSPHIRAVARKVSRIVQVEDAIDAGSGEEQPCCDRNENQKPMIQLSSELFFLFSLRPHFPSSRCPISIASMSFSAQPNAYHSSSTHSALHEIERPATISSDTFRPHSYGMEGHRLYEMRI
nr:hypothetical protein CFP56_30782 [Quercus suber]